MSEVPNGSRAKKDRLGSLSKSIETLRLTKKSIPMLCMGAFPLVKEGICLISLAISFQLGVRGDLG